MHTTTYGVGEMIRDAITCGCRKFILGIGGSATNDAGIGMLQALGYQFLDAIGREVDYGAEGLAQVRSITTEDVMPELASCTFQIACDVTNPLVGAQGCSAVFAPQKGADAKMVQAMDAAMNRYADIVEDMYRKNPTLMENQLTGYDEADKNVEKNDRQSQVKNRMTPGAGAAGGLGYACLMFLHAALKPGIDIVLDEIQIAQAIKTADAVITGEGRFDVGVDRAGLLLDKDGGSAHAPAAAHDDNEEDRHHDAHDQRQPPFDREHDDERAHDRDHRDEQILGAVVGKFGDLEQVGGQAAHELAGAVVVIEIEAQLLHVCEQDAADVRLDADAEGVTPVADDEIQE